MTLQQDLQLENFKHMIEPIIGNDQSDTAIVKSAMDFDLQATQNEATHCSTTALHQTFRVAVVAVATVLCT